MVLMHRIDDATRDHPWGRGFRSKRKEWPADISLAFRQGAEWSAWPQHRRLL